MVPTATRAPVTGMVAVGVRVVMAVSGSIRRVSARGAWPDV
jgi:hypothetical protein